MVGGLVWKDTGRETPITCPSLRLLCDPTAEFDGTQAPACAATPPPVCAQASQVSGQVHGLGHGSFWPWPHAWQRRRVVAPRPLVLSRGRERGEPNGPCARRSCCPHDAMPASPGLTTASRQGGGSHLGAYGRSHKAIHGRSVVPVQRLNGASLEKRGVGKNGSMQAKTPKHTRAKYSSGPRSFLRDIARGRPSCTLVKR